VCHRHLLPVALDTWNGCKQGRDARRMTDIVKTEDAEQSVAAATALLLLSLISGCSREPMGMG